MTAIRAWAESWPLAEPFKIAGLTQTTAEVVVVEVLRDGQTGRGECERVSAFDATLPDPLAVVGTLSQDRSPTRAALQSQLPAGPARNALDCALWDLEAKLSGMAVAGQTGLERSGDIITAYTISLDDPDVMASAAARQAHRPLLKLKLGGKGDDQRVAAVRAAVPHARLIVDANCSWTPEHYAAFAPAFAQMKVEMIEQPFAPGADAVLASLPRPVQVCADESCTDSASLPRLIGLYDAVNIKLDKTGGLTEALVVKAKARAAGMRIMVGCMIGTSLATAPAFLLAQDVDWVDLDSPFLLRRDRQPGLSLQDGVLGGYCREIWG